jgi:hypothetical protein
MVVNTEVLIFLIVLNIHEWLFTGGARKSIIGGGGGEHDAPGAPGFLLINIHHKKTLLVL